MESITKFRRNFVTRRGKNSAKTEKKYTYNVVIKVFKGDQTGVRRGDGAVKCSYTVHVLGGIFQHSISTVEVLNREKRDGLKAAPT